MKIFKFCVMHQGGGALWIYVMHAQCIASLCEIFAAFCKIIAGQNYHCRYVSIIGVIG